MLSADRPAENLQVAGRAVSKPRAHKLYQMPDALEAVRHYALLDARGGLAPDGDGSDSMRMTIRFGLDDLTRVGFTISPMQHLVFGAWFRDSRDSGYAAQRWWRSVRRRVPEAARLFLAVANAHPAYVLDLLTPPVALTTGYRLISLADELDAIRSTGRDQLEAEVRAVAAMGAALPALRGLVDDNRGLERLTDSAHALFHACLADDWVDMQSRLRVDVDRRRATLGSAGLAEMLTGIHPGWQDPSTLTLHFSHGHGDVAVAADGSGLLLAPNLFRTGRISPVVNAWQRSMILYPADLGTSLATPPAADDSLAALLGRGRAAALRHIAAECTTAELALRMRVSAPTASVHAATLRAAGLVTTVRNGRSVLHSLTPTGAELLAINPAPR